MLDRPLSDLCSTVSCYALLLAAILPSVQVHGVQAPASSPPYPQVEHPQPHRHKNQLQPSPLFHVSSPTRTCEHALTLTVYLEPRAQRRWLSLPSDDLSAKREEQQHQSSYDRGYESRGHESRDNDSNSDRGHTSRFSDVANIHIPEVRSSFQPTGAGFRVLDQEDRHAQGCTRQRCDIMGAASTKQPRWPFDDPRCPSQLQNSVILPDLIQQSSSAPAASVTASAYCTSQRSPTEGQGQETCICLKSSLGVLEQGVCPVDEHSASWAYRSTHNSLSASVLRVSSGQATTLQHHEEHDSVGEAMLHLDTQMNRELPSSPARQTNQHQRGRSQPMQRPVRPHESMSPVIHIPSMIPIPSMPLEWIALIACGTLQSGVEHTLGPGVTALVLYPTLANDCSNLLPALNNHIPPVLMIADLKNAEKLVSMVEGLESEALLVAKISNDAYNDQQPIVKERHSMEMRVSCIADTSDHDICETTEQARGHGVSVKNDVDDFHQGHPFISQEEYHEGMISSPRLPSLLETKGSEAACYPRKSLVALDTGRFGEKALASFSKQDGSDAKTTGPHGSDDPVAIMASTSYSPQSSNSPLSRHVGSRFAHDTANDNAAPGSTMRCPDDMTMVTTAATSTPTCSRFRRKARANCQDESDLSAPLRQLNAVTRFDDGHGQRVRRIAQPPPQTATGASPSFFNSSQLAYISGKIALVLLTSICLIGVIMFGALLFVLAVKVRLFRTRRPSNLYSHSARQFRNGHQPLGRNLNSSSNRKVVPQHVLESFKVQTVLQTSPTAVALSASVTCRRSRAKREKMPWRSVCTENTSSMEVSESFRTRNHGRSEAQEPFGQQAQERRPSLDGSDSLPAAVALGDESEKGNGDDFSDEDNIRSESDAEASFDDAETESVWEHSDDAERSTSATVTSRGISDTSSGLIDSSSSPSSSSSNSPDSARLSDTPRGAAERNGHKRRNQRRHPMAIQGPLELPFANANAQTACSICLTEYEVGEQVRTLPCFHQYHQGCIDPWLLHVVSLCPMCKRDLHPAPSVDESIAPIAPPLSLTAEPML